MPLALKDPTLLPNKAYVAGEWVDAADGDEAVNQVRVAGGHPGTDVPAHRVPDQVRPLDRIGSLLFANVCLNRVRQCLEEVAILPGADIEAGGERLGLSRQAAGEIPARGAVADPQRRRVLGGHVDLIAGSAALIAPLPPVRQSAGSR